MIRSETIAMRIVVTDLTRFANQDIVCIAGICPETKACIRPRPYLSRSRCEELNMLPGAVLNGDFRRRKSSPPHVEDYSYSRLSFGGPCSAAMFHKILCETSVTAVEEGFSVRVPPRQKYIPVDNPPGLSIVTTSVNPRHLKTVRDRYNEEKLKVHLRDGSGKEFRYMSITDLGFYEYTVRSVGNTRALRQLNDFIGAQDELFLRIGLSREYTSPDGRRGFWMQANGIYTFPGFIEEIRSYRRS